MKPYVLKKRIETFVAERGQLPQLPKILIRIDVFKAELELSHYEKKPRPSKRNFEVAVGSSPCADFSVDAEEFLIQVKTPLLANVRIQEQEQPSFEIAGARPYGLRLSRAVRAMKNPKEEPPPKSDHMSIDKVKERVSQFLASEEALKEKMIQIANVNTR